jgi:hypothetical protein
MVRDEKQTRIELIDECHRSAWGKWSVILTDNPDAVHIGLVPKSRGERAASFSYKNKRWLRELPERTGKVLVSIARQFENGGIEELETTNLFDEAEIVASGGFESLVGLHAQPQQLIQETKVRILA